jgi:hypothetical protein
MSRRYVPPPPTRFGPAPVQAKPSPWPGAHSSVVRSAGIAPPPTKFGLALGQKKPASALSRHSVIQPSMEAEMLTHVIKKSKTPEIYWFTFDAIDKGAPTTLTYVENKASTVYVRLPNQAIVHNSLAGDNDTTPVTIRDVAREKVFNLGQKLVGASKDYKTGYSRDEYPYASTLECGTDAFVAYVPEKEQQIQGGQLSGLYRNLKNGDRFKVVLDPS